ncbi:response regulator transcription factor [Candidatus Parcubacteria bacterium]|nr:response regulator transcription factor [Patescibacteria group bacterium]MCG2693991.1 response regulator transcription factor [Candidatus Parcubacteria bacterium]
MRILIVEDDKGISDFLKKKLKNELFIVDTATDGDRGSFLGCTNEYDLIILDYSLPKKDGKQICEEIRKKRKTAPILMLSVNSGTTIKIECLNVGADDYMTKPYSFDELLARVRALLRRPKQIKSEVIKIGKLLLDSKKHLVAQNGKQLLLTPKEFMLLEYLMNNRGLVLSRKTLLEHVWDINADPFSNTIEAHILNLRKKIGLSQKKIIQTVRGKGYKIE